jgi:voltage-gated potassium channel
MQSPKQHKKESGSEKTLKKERYTLLRRIENLLEWPMVLLGFIWLVLLAIELIWGLSPILQTISNIIWGIFILDFLGRLMIAPDKKHYLKNNWLTGLSLVLPALRLFRIFRALRLLQTAGAARGMRLVKVVASVNRGMKSLSATLQRRAFGYVLAVTILVVLTGAAGIFAFEHNINPGLNTYGRCLWFTAMLMTSIGSEAWPRSAEGQTLCFILALYGFAVFGYFTAVLATHFTGRDAANKRSDIAGASQIDALQQELHELRKELAAFMEGQKKHDV